MNNTNPTQLGTCLVCMQATDDPRRAICYNCGFVSHFMRRKVPKGAHAAEAVVDELMRNSGLAAKFGDRSVTTPVAPLLVRFDEDKN